VTKPGRYRLRPLAAKDIEDIGRFTLRRWGRKQQRLYLGMLRERLSLLALHPHQGIARDAISPGVRSAHVGRHMILYRVVDHEVQVLRVLHDSMELSRHRLGG
jgi:toxin ParE1/3/4